MSPHIDLLAHLARPRSRSLRRSTSVWAPSRHWATVAGHAAFGDEAWPASPMPSTPYATQAPPTTTGSVGSRGIPSKGWSAGPQTLQSIPEEDLARRYLDDAMAHIMSRTAKSACGYDRPGVLGARLSLPRARTAIRDDAERTAPAAADMALRLDRLSSPWWRSTACSTTSNVSFATAPQWTRLAGASSWQGCG